MKCDATAIQPLPIFVYGTLMVGQPNDYIWQESVSAVEIAFVNEACLYDFGYFPIMTEEPRYQVKGQLFHVRQDRFPPTIARLDLLEGFDPASPHLSNFRRISTSITTLKGEIGDAWTYVGTSEQVQGLPVIEPGDWVAYIAARAAETAAWLREIDDVSGYKRRDDDSDH